MLAKARLILLMLLLLPFPAYAEESIGKIISREGLFKKTNINCSSEECRKTDFEIYPGERIVTGKNSSARILLKDGTAIVLLGSSDIIINRVKLRDRDKPGDIIINTGRLKLIQKNSFMDTSLVISTPVSVIKSVNSAIDIVAARFETALFVYAGEAGFASNNPAQVEAYILKEGEESIIRRDESPSRPVSIQRILRNSWLERNFVSKDRRSVLRYKRKSGAADWPFIKND